MEIHSQGHLEKRIFVRPDLGHWTNEKVPYKALTVKVLWQFLISFQKGIRPEMTAIKKSVSG